MFFHNIVFSFNVLVESIQLASLCIVFVLVYQGIAPLNRVLPCDSFVRATTASSFNNIGWRLTYDEVYIKILTASGT